jgi:small subunit ribosomal protein S16
MSVKIRLARRGRRKLAIYDVVVADARAPRDGRFIEKIGSYNPNTNPASININNERALKWLLNGAQPTDTVKAMLSYRGIMLKKHLQIGVLKGAITQEVADAKFEAWLNEKDTKIAGKSDTISKAKADVRQKALNAESAKNQARVDAFKAKEDEQKALLAAAEAANNPAPVVKETPEAEAIVEETVAVVEETPAVEAVVAETPAVEEAEAPAVEETVAAEETPAVEAVVAETPAVEEAAPVAEAKAEETPAAEEATPEAPADGEDKAKA